MGQVCKAVSGARRTRLLPLRIGRASNEDGWLRTFLVGLRRSLASAFTRPRSGRRAAASYRRLCASRAAFPAPQFVSPRIQDQQWPFSNRWVGECWPSCSLPCWVGLAFLPCSPSGLDLCRWQSVPCPGFDARGATLVTPRRPLRRASRRTGLKTESRYGRCVLVAAEPRLPTPGSHSESAARRAPANAPRPCCTLGGGRGASGSGGVKPCSRECQGSLLPGAKSWRHISTIRPGPRGHHDDSVIVADARALRMGEQFRTRDGDSPR